MVMKYAVSENSAITLQNQMKQLESKIRDNLKEKESLEGKIGSVVGEKGKLLQVINSKVGVKLNNRIVGFFPGCFRTRKYKDSNVKSRRKKMNSMRNQVI